MKIRLKDVLKKARDAYIEGNYQEAHRLYSEILKAQPEHPTGNHNMGILSVKVGKIQDSLPFFKTALRANPQNSRFWISYINVLLNLDRLADAKIVFEQAEQFINTSGADFEKFKHKLYGIDTSSLSNMKLKENQHNILDSLELDEALKIAKAKAKAGAAREAIRIYKEILKKFPKNKEASFCLNSLTDEVVDKKSQTSDPSVKQQEKLVSLYNQGRLKKALNKTSSLIKRFPNSAMLFNLKGAVYLKLRQLNEAAMAFNKALVINPEFPDAWINTGIVLQEQGDLAKALTAYGQALTLHPGIAVEPAYYEVFQTVGHALKGVRFRQPNRNFQRIIVSLLKKENLVRPADLATSAVSLLKYEEKLTQYFCAEFSDKAELSLQQIIEDLSMEPLLLTLMEACPIPDLEIERLLKVIRKNLLLSMSSISHSSEVIKFQSAIALQCFINEYIYDQSKTETRALEILEFSVNKVLIDGKQPSPLSVLCLASYKPLFEYEWCDLLVPSSEIEVVLSRQIFEPQREEKLKISMPTLGVTNDRVSTEVRAQYENNPYPRWVNSGFTLTPLSISEKLNEPHLRLVDKEILSAVKPEILIAGCGTGQHAISTALKFKDCKVLAVDLSFSSLAYAKRKTEELGIKNIEYMQADILNLRNLNRRFDIIESAGVLHHMENPLTGWEILTDCLKPGGLIYIGLYSELARKHIAKMREEISLSGISASDLEMKAYRDTVSNSDKKHHVLIHNSGDFYSLSTIRDLLFHVQEHRFTIHQIKNCLVHLGLSFCGFDEKTIAQNFRKMFSDSKSMFDLDKWQEYEKINPRTFAGMYLFWSQKIK